MKYAGVGWPTGAVDLSRILSLPSPRLLMLSGEARWHLDEAAAAGKQTLWRAVPEPGQRMAEVGYSPYRYAQAALAHLDEQRTSPAGFIGWNEPDLRDERGTPNEDDWSNLEQRYTLLGSFFAHLLPALREGLPEGTDLHFGAFTPDHYALDYVDRWREAAEYADCIDLHAYGSTETILNHYAAYRAAFPRARLEITEWHASGDLESERQTLQALADLAEQDPLFVGADFFIWRWDNAPSWWSSSYDIEHNDARLALFRDPPVSSVPVPVEPPNPEPAPEPAPLPEPAPTPVEIPPMTQDEILVLLAQTARAHGIPTQLLVACAVAESGLDPNARRPTDPAFDARYWPDVSFGLCQQTVRWAVEYQGGPDFPGADEIARVGALYLDPAHAADVAAGQLAGKYFADENDAMFAALCRYNWPGGHGAPATDGVGANYRRGMARAVTLLYGPQPAPEPIPIPVPVYDPTTPALAQNHPWDCAEESTFWAMTAWGRHPSDDWMESSMLGESVESTEDGLRDASGAALAAWVREQYGEFGYDADNHDPVSFDDLAAEAGQYPIMAGGRAWGHWTGVRGYDGSRDVLLLANPADGWMNVRQTMTRAQFAALGPFSMVRVTHAVPADPPVDPPPPIPEEDPAVIAELQQQIADLRNLVGNAYSETGVVLPPLERVVAGRAADGHRLTKAEMVQETAGVVGFLKANRP